MIGGLLQLPNDDARKIVFVALGLCLVCSLLVSASAVLLRPIQQAEAALDQQRNVVVAAGLGSPDMAAADVAASFAQLQVRVVDFETGWFNDSIDPATYDPRAAARDPSVSSALTRAEDTARIGRQARYATVYLQVSDNGLQRIVLPIHGYGLWSTMYAYLALEGDLNTVAAVAFYEQAETPGLGGEVQNPRWQASWEGKLVFGDEGDVRLRVIKGQVDRSSPQAQWQLDALSGSTLTANGVSNMLSFWLGEEGFGPFLNKLRREGV